MEASSSELERLAVYLANLYVLTSDASPPVLPDAAAVLDGGWAGAAPAALADAVSGLNLILVGGPHQNAASAAVAAYWAQVGHGAAWSPSYLLTYSLTD